MKRLRDMTDDELMFARNKAKREGNRALALKIMRKIMRRGQQKDEFLRGR